MARARASPAYSEDPRDATLIKSTTIKDEGDIHTRGKLCWTSFALLAWSSIGIIFGDIATSPLYVYSSIFAELVPNGYPNKSDVMGSASLIFWTLTLVVMVKYLGVVLKADDQGQGGTFALYSLLCRNMGIKPHGARGSASTRKAHTNSKTKTSGASRPPVAAATEATATCPGDVDDDSSSSESDKSDSDKDEVAMSRSRPWWRWGAMRKEVFHEFFRRSRRAQIALWGIAVIATAMLMGDGVLTPAMSVLSAVSGLTVVAPSLNQNVVIGITILVLFLVFAIQPMGTRRVGSLFAPIIMVWLLANAAVNCYNLSRHGGAVFGAVNPVHIVRLFSRHGAVAWKSLGAVMLCVTGAEALFADLGHFSRGSISVAFGVLAYPCLVITYFGQAAHVVAYPHDTDVFWRSLPRQLLYPMLVLATLATIVASQALISGLFSIIRQAMILGAFPPARIIHTGGKKLEHATQVYIPLVNVVLFVLCCIVVGGFQDTVALGKAYGLAVMTDMMTTTGLIMLVMLCVWELSLLLVVPFVVVFLVVEGAYWSANIIKVPQGGWFTLAVAAVVALLMLIWWAGSRRLGKRLAQINEGASIRVLGATPNPPLIAQPPGKKAVAAASPLLLRVPSIPTAAAAAATGGVARQRLYRLSNWALPLPMFRSTDLNNNGKSRSISAPVSRHGVRAMSLPLPRFNPRAPMSPQDRSAFSPFRPSQGVSGTVLEKPKDRRSSGGGALPLQLQPVSSQPDSSAAVAEQRSTGREWHTDTTADGGGGGIGGSCQRTMVVSEASFTPGTLALVLPADKPHDLRSLTCGAADASVIVELDGGADGDVEMGGGAEAAAHLAHIVVPLTARLPGIGVYYMDEKVGDENSTLDSLPPVLVHFLKNVHAIHEVCVFLAVRNLPVPRISRRQRLQIYTPRCASVPNFYQVVARYGYLDEIDHGPAFMSELVDAIYMRLALVEEHAARGRLPRAYSIAMASWPRVEGETVPDGPGEGASNEQPVEKPLVRWGHRNPLMMIQIARNKAEAAAEAMAPGPADMAAAATTAGDAAAHSSAFRAAKAQMEAAVAAFMEARLQGVVYYGSRAVVRLDLRPGSGVIMQYVNWVLYGLLYRWLAAIAYVDMERWRVPSQQLVELGMPVYI